MVYYAVYERSTNSHDGRRDARRRTIRTRRAARAGARSSDENGVKRFNIVFILTHSSVTTRGCRASSDYLHSPSRFTSTSSGRRRRGCPRHGRREKRRGESLLSVILDVVLPLARGGSISRRVRSLVVLVVLVVLVFRDPSGRERGDGIASRDSSSRREHVPGETRGEGVPVALEVFPAKSRGHRQVGPERVQFAVADDGRRRRRWEHPFPGRARRGAERRSERRRRRGRGFDRGSVRVRGRVRGRGRQRGRVLGGRERSRGDARPEGVDVTLQETSDGVRVGESRSDQETGGREGRDRSRETATAGARTSRGGVRAHDLTRRVGRRGGASRRSSRTLGWTRREGSGLGAGSGTGTGIGIGRGVAVGAWPTRLGRLRRGQLATLGVGRSALRRVV